MSPGPQRPLRGPRGLWYSKAVLKIVLSDFRYLLYQSVRRLRFSLTWEVRLSDGRVFRDRMAGCMAEIIDGELAWSPHLLRDFARRKVLHKCHDISPDLYYEVADRLRASPHFAFLTGERLPEEVYSVRGFTSVPGFSAEGFKVFLSHVEAMRYERAAADRARRLRGGRAKDPGLHIPSPTETDETGRGLVGTGPEALGPVPEEPAYTGGPNG